MIREIVKFGSPVLRQRCEEVTKFDGNLGRILDDMYETMSEADGIGIAAPQIGLPARLIVIDVDRRIEIVNPVIVSAWGRQFEAEGCLSWPGKRGIVKRPRHVKVKGLDRFGKPVKFRAKNLLARALCHEIDHLDGILFEDKVLEWVEDEPEDSKQAKQRRKTMIDKR